ncbi:MAG: hypothetical protein ABI445_21925 [Polyangia bacterium]
MRRTYCRSAIPEGGAHARRQGAIIKIGDFFKTSTHCNPVNAKPVTYTCIAKGETLPGGEKNPAGRVVRAKFTSAFTFVDADQTLKCRIDSRRALRERLDVGLKEGQMPEPLDDGDLGLEVTYQLLAVALREYDADTKRAGDPQFPTVELVRELIIPGEANRLYAAYQRYVADEHPSEAPSEATFSPAKGGGRAVAR